jgi:hypothetical protein
VGFFVTPFAALFALFYLVPIGYAVVQSLYQVKRTGTFGPAHDVFGGLVQYRRVFSDSPFWHSVERVLLFGVVQVPVMLGLALILALLLDSGLVRGKRFFRLAFFLPYAVPGVVAAIMWGYLYSPNLSPFTAVTAHVHLLGADLVLWSIANVVTWVYVGYNMLIIYAALLAIPPEIYEGHAGDRAHHRLLDHRHAATARRAAGVPQLLDRGVQHLHAEPDRLRHLVGAELPPGRRVLGGARSGHVRPLVHLPQVHPAQGRPMSGAVMLRPGPRRRTSADPRSGGKQ